MEKRVRPDGERTFDRNHQQPDAAEKHETGMTEESSMGRVICRTFERVVPVSTSRWFHGWQHTREVGPSHPPQNTVPYLVKRPRSTRL